jgi:hypothetical protein
LHRYLNVIYWWWRSRLTKEDEIKAFERSLDPAPVDPTVPSWWHGEEEAAASSMALARSLGLRTPALGT